MPSIDPFLDRMPRKGYNCRDFAREVYLYLTGEDINKRMHRLLSAFAAKRCEANTEGFEHLPKPISPCLVLMQRAKLVPHVGVYYDGRVLHLTAHGVQFQPINIARGYFQTIGYYR